MCSAFEKNLFKKNKKMIRRTIWKCGFGDLIGLSVFALKPPIISNPPLFVDENHCIGFIETGHIIYQDIFYTHLSYVSLTNLPKVWYKPSQSKQISNKQTQIRIIIQNQVYFQDLMVNYFTIQDLALWGLRRNFGFIYSPKQESI